MPDHNGDDQFLILFPILKDYDIVRKLKTIIADNTLSNNVLYRLIENH
jgi:hypothetical protein